jgi:uncharacterized YceG family protein
VARPPDERTPEERAAAAAERAARRAERGGEGPTDAPPAETFAGNAAPRPAPALAARAASAPRTLTPRPLEDEPFAQDAYPEPEPEPDPPAPPRRVSPMAARAPRRPPRRPPPPRRRPPAPRQRSPRGGHGRRRFAALLAIVLLAAALYALNATFQPFHGEGEGAVQVKVPAGANAGKIGTLLEERGVVDSATFFQLNATVTGRRGKLRPGDYTLLEGMSNGAAIDALVKGPKAKVVKTVNVTVPEGLSIREAAPVVDKGPLKGSYLKAARSARTLRRIRELGAPRGTRTAEGFLFPATYTLLAEAPARNLVDRQLASFRENMAKVDLSYAKRKNLTRYDVLIIASMVEREAQLDRERPLVAAVIYNRLKEGMTLGIDATIRYYENNWQRPLRVSELERDSPYNTRLNRGLPPTPIGNPGLASIEAAANPERGVDYLFYVRKPGDSGEHAFSSTDAQFQRDVARYQASREP